MEHDPKRPLKIISFLTTALIGYWAVRTYVFPPGVISWRDDLPAAKLEAARVGKPLLVYFTADWCPPCQEMKSTTWNDTRVGEVVRDYVPVMIDVDEQGDVARKFGVRGIPRVQMLLPDGQQGEAVVGYVSADDMVAWLK